METGMSGGQREGGGRRLLTRFAAGSHALPSVGQPANLAASMPIPAMQRQRARALTAYSKQPDRINIAPIDGMMPGSSAGRVYWRLAGWMDPDPERPPTN